MAAPFIRKTLLRSTSRLLNQNLQDLRRHPDLNLQAHHVAKTPLFILFYKDQSGTGSVVIDFKGEAAAGIRSGEQLGHKCLTTKTSSTGQRR